MVFMVSGETMICLREKVFFMVSVHGFPPDPPSGRCGHAPAVVLTGLDANIKQRYWPTAALFNVC